MALAVVTHSNYLGPSLRVHTYSVEPEGWLAPKMRLQKLRLRASTKRMSLSGHVPGLIVPTPLSEHSPAARLMLGNCSSVISPALPNSPEKKATVTQEEAAKRGGWLP